MRMESLEKKLEYLKAVPELYDFTVKNCFIAGGAVRDVNRGVAPKDYDLFFRTDAAIAEFKQKFSHFCVETGLGNYNWGEFQFITLYSGTPQEVIETFDWNVNQHFYEFGKLNVRFPFLSQVGGYTTEVYLRFNPNARTPLQALMRIPEMIEKGFKIQKEEFLFALTFCSQVCPLTTGTDFTQHFEAISSGGSFLGSAAAEGAVQRASEEAQKHSPLAKALK